MSPETKAALAGSAILVFGSLGRWATGTIYSTAKALDLIEAVRSSALYLGEATAGSAATTLALMLTLVGFIHRDDRDFGRIVYLRIRNVARLSALSLVGSVVLLLVLTLPMKDFDKLPLEWYPRLYNGIYSLVIALSALVVATVTLLFLTLVSLIADITPTDEV